MIYFEYSKLMIIFFCLVGCSISKERIREKYLSIPLSEVVKSPEKYHQKKIRVSGVAYFTSHWEGRSLLFTDEENYNKEYSLSNIGMWFEPELSKFDLKKLEKNNGKKYLVVGILRDTGEKAADVICIRGCQSRAYLHDIEIVEEVLP